LGHGDTALAMLATLPLCAGALTQAFTGPLVLWLGSRKRLVAIGALVQAVSHLGLIAISALSLQSFWLLLALVLLYYVAGMAIAPAWGAWMGALTERRDRERYFAFRSTCVSVAMLGAFVWAGLHLRDAAKIHDVSHAYALLFSVGLVARLASTAMLIKQADPWPATRDSLKRVMARTRLAVRSDGFRWPMLLALWLFGAHVSIPFYAPYMLKTLGIGYEGFALLCAVQLATKAIAFPFTCRVAAKLGLERMLALAIGLTAMTTYLWGSQTSLASLVLAQALSGAAWASYEFSSFQLLLRSAKPSQRVEFLAMSASLGGFMQLSGALLGSFLLARLGLAYREVFLVSAGLRALPLLLIVPAALDRRAVRARELARD
ncbi:MAG TPA: MFS transporter, partial [Polyangiales bacterium]|nr:MFS transporter [Polyangiales bacterium]